VRWHRGARGRVCAPAARLRTRTRLPRGSERLRAKAVAYVKKRMTVMRFLTHARQRRWSWRVSARLAWVGNETAHYAPFRSPLGEPRPPTMPRGPGADHDPHPLGGRDPERESARDAAPNAPAPPPTTRSPARPRRSPHRARATPAAGYARRRAPRRQPPARASHAASHPTS